MKVSKLLIGAFASLTILLASCGGDTKTAKDGHRVRDILEELLENYFKN